MKSFRNIALALGASLAASAAFAGSALAEPGHVHDETCHHDNDGRNDLDNDRYDGDDNDRWGRDDGNGSWDGNGRRDDGGRWDGGGRWSGPQQRNLVPVRVMNQRDRPVTLFLNGQYLGRVQPFSRERIYVPAGYHTLTYKVGWRGGFQAIGVSAVPGAWNRVVIEGWRGGGGWGRNWGY